MVQPRRRFTARGPDATQTAFEMTGNWVWSVMAPRCAAECNDTEMKCWKSPATPSPPGWTEQQAITTPPEIPSQWVASRGCVPFRPQWQGGKRGSPGTDRRSRWHRPVTRRQRSNRQRRWVDTQRHERPVRGVRNRALPRRPRVNAMRIRATESFLQINGPELSKWSEQMSLSLIEAFCDRFSSPGRFTSSSHVTPRAPSGEGRI